MVANKHLDAKRQPGAEPNPDASAIFGTMVEARGPPRQGPRSAARPSRYGRMNSVDQTSEGSLLILSKLRRALRAERRRALAGHWSYELNRHLGLADGIQSRAWLDCAARSSGLTALRPSPRSPHLWPLRRRMVKAAPVRPANSLSGATVS